MIEIIIRKNNHILLRNLVFPPVLDNQRYLLLLLQSIADHVAELLELLLVVSHKSRLQRLAHHDASVLQCKRTKARRDIGLAKHRLIRNTSLLLHNRRHGSNLLYNLNLELLLLLLTIFLWIFCPYIVIPVSVISIAMSGQLG